MEGRSQIIQVPEPRYQTGFLGSISSVKINGVAVPPRRIYEHSGPAELVLEGENLTPDTLKLYHNGVLYAPLGSSDTYAYYMLGDNGTNKVMLNGSNFCTVIVKDVVVPTNITKDGLAALLDAPSLSANRAYQTPYQGDTCINFGHVANSEFPYFYIRVGSLVSLVGDDIEYINCEANYTTFSESAPATIFILSVIDATKPAYIKYQGFIIAVFNYSA